jgi:signal transduction histidine kinase
MVSVAPVEALQKSAKRGSSRQATPMRPPRLGMLMILAIAAVAALAYWDAQRESTSALADFAEEQAQLARSVALAVAGRVRFLADGSVRENADVFADVRSLERPSIVRLLLMKPGQEGLVTTDQRVVHDPRVERGVHEGTPWLRLDRTEAPAFGLPERTAVAGISTFDGPSGRWGIVVVATALRERDRELRVQWRSVIAVVVASGLVLLFGGLAMRKQRKELDLARELAVAELEHDKEQQLVQIDKLAMLAALATGIAHEVSTPLGVIVGRAEQLLPKVSQDERARKGVESIIEQGTRISRVIRGFLNLARGESPPLEHVNPGTVAEAARELVEHRFENAGVRLSVTIDDDLPDVACDPRLLEQVLINLLLNACDACDRGGHVELVVRADSERVGFVVVDDGVGITPEAAARATEPFFTTKPLGQGTGLGLAIATEIVKHHNGHFSIAPRNPSHAGDPSRSRGTRASVELPVAKEPA